MTSAEPLDLLIVGSGVAGLSAAVRAAEFHDLRVGVVTKGQLDQTATRWAQGGVAAVLRSDPDSTDLHLADTLRAGADLCDEDAVRVLVDEGPARVVELIALGAVFDVGPDGQYVLNREGGHSMPRILSSRGAATGIEVERALVEATRATAVVIREDTFVADVVVDDDGACAGVRVVAPDGEVDVVAARNVLLASGGAGQMFAVTTNPSVATGDGMAMAARAGAALADLEFVQFHPTALYVDRSPRPLMTEALRGHGALLRDAAGERFVDELLPRDQVSRAITAAIAGQDRPHVWLDLTSLHDFAHRFPTLATELDGYGIDWQREWVPVAPAAHYCCGGVLTDLDGATTVPGLWAAGEAASAGVHGANRLASNSLLDGMVFGTRVVSAVAEGRRGPSATGAMTGVLGDDRRPGAVGTVVLDVPRLPGGAPDRAAGDDARARLQEAMTEHAGVLRDAASLDLAAEVIHALATRPAPELGRHADGATVAALEHRNLLELANLTVRAARARTETRGAHTRADHPDTDPALRTRFVLRP